MELVNNRYRIIRHLKQNRLYSCYLVSDIMNNYKELQLVIFNSEYMEKKLIDYYIDNYHTLSEMDCNGVIKLYEFGIVNTIDNKKHSNMPYYLIEEYFEPNITITDALKDKSFSERISCFMKICSYVCYLHLWMPCYGEINLSTVLVSLRNDICSIKLKNVATIEMDKYNMWESQNEFKAPEVLAGQAPNTASDIYSLGVLLLMILIQPEKDDAEPLQLLNDFKNIIEIQNHGDEYSKLSEVYDIISKMLNNNQQERYESVKSLIKEFNNVLGTSYKPYHMDEIEKLHFNIKIVEREKEINKVMEAYDQMSKYQTGGKMVVIHGDSGVGKTRLLQECYYRLTLNRANVYSMFKTNSYSIKNQREIPEFMKKIISDSDKRLIKKYENQLGTLFPELLEKKSNSLKMNISENLEEAELAKDIFGFVDEFAKDKCIVFIIDNIHRLNEFAMTLIEYICKRNLKNRNILMIMSYTDSEIKNYTKLQQLVGGFGNKEDVIDLPIHELDNRGTSELVKCILGIQYTPIKFSTRIYTSTYGNPLFVFEVIKDLFVKGLIYIDPFNGNWQCDYRGDNYNELPIPINMEQAVMSQISGITDNEYNVLSIISVFTSAVSSDILIMVMNDDKDKINSCINSLVNKGILIRMVEDRGFAYDFYNKTLRSIIYSRLTSEDKKLKHAIIANAIEKNISVTYYKELIYHLKNAGNIEKAAEYCIKNADKLSQLKDYNEAAKCLEKGIKMFGKDSYDSTKLKLMITHANLCEEQDDSVEAMKDFKEAERIAEKNGSIKYKIDIYNSLADLYVRRNDDNSALSYIERVEKELKNTEYEEGFWKSQYIRAKIYFKNQEYENVFGITKNCIEKCNGKYISILGNMYRVLGNAYVETNKIEEALKSYNSSKECFEKIDDIRNTLKALNNIAVVYGDYYQDEKRAIKQFLTMKDLCEKENITRSNCMLFANIGESYYNIGDYDNALKWFLDALDKSVYYQQEELVFYCYNYICLIYLEMGDYINAQQYYSATLKEIERYPSQGMSIGIYYYVRARFLFSLGDMEESKDYARKCLNLYGDAELRVKRQCEILLKHIEIVYTSDEHKISSIIDDITDIVNKYKLSVNRIQIYMDTAIILYENMHRKHVKKVYHMAKAIKSADITERIKDMGLYVKAVISLGSDNYYEKCLQPLCDNALKHKNKEMLWRAYYAIGNYYYTQKNYFSAFSYYIEACDIIKRVVMEMPVEYKLGYINTSGRCETFRRLIRLKEERIYAHPVIDKAMDCEKVGGLDELQEVMDIQNSTEILKNREFIKAISDTYNYNLPYNISSIKDIILNLCSDPMKNLELIITYMAGLTIASKWYVAICNPHTGYKLIYSNSGLDTDINKTMLDRARLLNKPLLVNDGYAEVQDNGKSFISDDIRAAICMPVTMKCERDSEHERRKRNVKNSGVKGLIYLETARALNNFNEESLNNCMELIRLAGIIIEEYVLKVTSSIDKLTGALIRKYLENAIDETIERCDAEGECFSMLMIDIDHFKSINDRYGHQTGDEVLTKLGSIIISNIRNADAFGRYGGEEFIVVLPYTSKEDAFSVGEKIRKSVEQGKILGSNTPVTISVGIACFPEHGRWRKDLVNKVDQALYVAKESGRNRCQIWGQEFANISESNYKLKGIVSGNVLKDSRNILTVIELIECIKKDDTKQDMIYSVLGTMLDSSEADKGCIFIVKDGKYNDCYCRRMLKDGWSEMDSYDKNLIANVIKDKKGKCLIDWDYVSEYDPITGNPDWQSVMVVPMIYLGVVRGILYLSVSTSHKEFDNNDLNLINTLADIAAAVI